MSLLAALGGSEELPAQCSRAGCDAPAAFALEWRNPRIHTAGRTKTWLACAEHREYLEQFLGARDFPVTTTAFGGRA